ncbi:MAG: FAD-dependent 5-carboxymethylaminomethyl-2-thiouridine(34) oxidoreductase MnmC [Pseudomonadota bacterium]|jgi:tRNA 5-methylaminomethyl-2-thiouridine biosynthesis bifunctional protein
MADDDLEWTEGGLRSRRFADIYYSTQGGLEETRRVFLEGCGLPQAWAGRSRFTVAELGFGTGLNIAALIDLWRRTRPADGRLSVFSVEAFPMSADAAARALSDWPEIAEVSSALLAAWPDGRCGFHRIDLPEFHASLDLAVMDAGEALAAWRGSADAWFLDGFAPAKNPGMWSAAVLDQVRAKSAPGCRLATFTVAGKVRRGLAERGFLVEKKPGHGFKRERLEARLEGEVLAPSTPPRAAVIGAGIAGASLVRALHHQGLDVRLFEKAKPGAGGSGNPTGLVTPRLDAGLGPIAQLYAQAFARAVQVYRNEATAALVARGVCQQGFGDKDAARFAAIAAWDGFAPGALTALTPAETAERLDEPDIHCPGLWFRDALVVEPKRILEAFLAGTPVQQKTIVAIESCEDGWRLRDETGAEAGEFDLVMLATAFHTNALIGTELRPVRGQVATVEGIAAGRASAWGGYAIPTRTGLLYGATHDRGDAGEDIRLEDDARNLALLQKGRPRLAAAVEASSGKRGRRASVRAATPDHLPLAGAVAPGLYVLAGLGGRGLCLAPLLAEALVAEAVGVSSPLPGALLALCDPTRYGAMPL